MAGNHIFGDLVPITATGILILAISVMPVYARSQQPDTSQLKADAQNAFNIISSDKLKLRRFCEMVDLADQLDQAERMHDTKKALDVSQKMNDLEGNSPNILRWLTA